MRIETSRSPTLDRSKLFSGQSLSMGSPSRKRNAKGTRKIRVQLRRNRSKRARLSDWTQKVRNAEDHEIDADRNERVSAKGDLSRSRTIVVSDDGVDQSPDLRRGIVVAMHGLYADVDQDGQLYPCTIRRMLKTRLIAERQPVTVGDYVRFRVTQDRLIKHRRATDGPDSKQTLRTEGVIEDVEPRQGELRRRVGKRVHTIVTNVDQALIVSSADLPSPKPHLIDRYLVAAHAGDITPIICFNKADLGNETLVQDLLERYAKLGYTTLLASAQVGTGLEALRSILVDNSTVFVGQSGVGKSSLLNAIQPGLTLKTASIVDHTRKGRHTTATSSLIRLEIGGYVVDTPGVKSFDLSDVPRYELEALFIEFVEHVTHCKFPDCTHTHENSCAVKDAVVNGSIHPDRYESYVRIFLDPGGNDRKRDKPE